MSASIAELPGRRFASESQRYSLRDTLLYALGLGVGQDPCDLSQLRYLDRANPMVVPTQAAVLAASSDWMRDPASGIDWHRLVALSHQVDLDLDLPSEGNVESRLVVTDIFDRGPGDGAIICWERALFAEGGVRLALVRGRALARSDGGFGGRRPIRQTLPALQGGPVASVRWATHPSQAHLYALSGDANPLHLDPAVALAAGYPKPILHGLCSLGVCAVAVQRVVEEALHGAKLIGVGGRYAGVAYPGETLLVDVWRQDANTYRFRCTSEERQTVVVEDGVATCRPQDTYI